MLKVIIPSQVANNNISPRGKVEKTIKKYIYEVFCFFVYSCCFVFFIIIMKYKNLEKTLNINIATQHVITVLQVGCHRCEVEG